MTKCVSVWCCLIFHGGDDDSFNHCCKVRSERDYFLFCRVNVFKLVCEMQKNKQSHFNADETAVILMPIPFSGQIITPYFYLCRQSHKIGYELFCFFDVHKRDSHLIVARVKWSWFPITLLPV
jgi:hypothetical protein